MPNRLMLGRTDDAGTGTLPGTGRHRGTTRRAVVLALVVLAAGTVATVAGGARAAARVDGGTRVLMDQRAEIARQAMESESRRIVDSARLVAAACGHTGLTSADLIDAMAPLASIGLAGVSGVGFVVPAEADAVAPVQADWRRRGAVGLSLSPYGAGEHLFLVAQREFGLTREFGPAGVHLPGLDLAGSPEVAAALAEARRSGRVSLSNAAYPQWPAVPDPPSAGARSGTATGPSPATFVLAAPVYAVEPASDEPVFQGWVTFWITAPDLVDTVLGPAVRGPTGVRLTATGGDGRPVPVAALAPAHTPNLSRQEYVTMADRQWVLVTQARSSDLFPNPAGPPIVVTLVLSLLSILLALLVFLLVNQRIWANARLRLAVAHGTARGDLLKAVIDAATEGICVLDQDGSPVLRNAAAVSIFGEHPLAAISPRPFDDRYGIFLSDRITPCPADRIPQWRALAGEAVRDMELFVRNPTRPDGAVVRASAHPLRLGDGRVLAVTMFNDITIDRVREQELVAFASAVAHDLKSPLSAIAGFAEILSGRFAGTSPSPETTRLAADRIHLTARRLVTLINELLEYVSARDAPCNPQPVDLGCLAATVLAEQSVAHGVTRPQVYLGELPVVLGDPGAVHRLLDNLVSNAIAYAVPGQPARIDVTAMGVADGLACIEVADRGIGVADPDKERVLLPFVRGTVAGTVGGTGLGLAICRRIVERHGGRIVLSDNPGGGLRVRFTLPVADPVTLPGAEPAVPAVAAVPAPTRPAEPVLVGVSVNRVAAPGPR